jgi:cysteine desulfurase
MLHFLESKGIYVSSGSACSRGKSSRVLTAFGVSDKDADESLRVSISDDTTEDELQTLVNEIINGYNRLQKKK